MKRLLNLTAFCCLLAAVGMLAFSCEKVVEKECDKEHLPDVVPSLTLTAGTATVESLSFTLTPEAAVSVRYSVLESGSELPTAESLFDSASPSFGLPADASASYEYTVDGLNLGTDYVVAAAAKNNIGYSEVYSLSMTTDIPEMSLTLSLVKENSNSLSFRLTPVNAGKVAYAVVAADAEIPEAAAVLADGTEADASAAADYVVKGLEPETSYVIVAAALDLAGKNTLLSEPLTASTIAVIPPAVGDYYYSDGTWSTAYDSSKEPIGVVFYLGCATEFGDNPAYYKVKDGSAAMEEFHGYVIALKDASPEEGVFWSFYDGWDSGAGCSGELDDFLGYTNTIAIETTAAENGRGISESNDSYPATYYATVAYEEACPAPELSSGWFLPSAYQLKYIWEKVYFNEDGNLKGWIENSLKNLGDKAAEMYVSNSSYWTSTEYYDSYGDSCKAYYFNFDYASFSPGFIDWYTKDEEFRVRSVLAF